MRVKLQTWEIWTQNNHFLGLLHFHFFPVEIQKANITQYNLVTRVYKSGMETDHGAYIRTKLPISISTSTHTLGLKMTLVSVSLAPRACVFLNKRESYKTECVLVNSMLTIWLIEIFKGSKLRDQKEKPQEGRWQSICRQRAFPPSVLTRFLYQHSSTHLSCEMGNEINK